MNSSVPFRDLRIGCLLLNVHLKRGSTVREAEVMLCRAMIDVGHAEKAICSEKPSRCADCLLPPRPCSRPSVCSPPLYRRLDRPRTTSEQVVWSEYDFVVIAKGQCESSRQKACIEAEGHGVLCLTEDGMLKYKLIK